MGNWTKWWVNWIGHMEVQSGRNWREAGAAWLLDVIIEAGRRPRPELLPGLIWALGVPDPKIGLASADQIELVLSDCAPESLPGIDGLGRRLRPELLPVHLDVAGLDRILWRRAKDPAAPTGLLLACAMHRDGELRAFALARLGPDCGRAALAIALVRLDDWVPEVREQAERTLAKHLQVGDAITEHITALLPLALGLARRERAGGSPGLTRLLEQIAKAPAELELMALLPRLAQLEPTSLRRQLTHFLLTEVEGIPGPGRERILSATLGSPDLQLALATARLLFATATEAQKVPLAKSLGGDKREALRRIGLEQQVLATKNPHKLRSIIYSGLIDPSKRVRALSQELALRCLGLGRNSLLDFYRSALRSKDSKPGTVLAATGALGYLGEKPDYQELTEVLQRTDSRALAATALAGLARLGPHKTRSLLVQHLSSPSPRISKVALRALQIQARQGRAIEPKELAELTGSDYPSHVRRNALRLAADLAKWDSLSIILAALTGPTPTPVQLVEDSLERWLKDSNRSFCSPRPDQWHRAQNRLEEVGAQLPIELNRAIRSILRSLAHFGIASDGSS
jgi:hypothetical protein